MTVPGVQASVEQRDLIADQDSEQTEGPASETGAEIRVAGSFSVIRNKGPKPSPVDCKTNFARFRLRHLNCDE